MNTKTIAEWLHLPQELLRIIILLLAWLLMGLSRRAHGGSHGGSGLALTHPSPYYQAHG